MFLVSKTCDLIIIKLQGGLGNQMFQYAYSTALQAATGAQIYFDYHFFEARDKLIGATPRNYELDIFGITAPRPPVISDFGKWLRRIKRIKPDIPAHFSESSLLFDASFLRLPDPCIVQGYFASEKYFFSVADIIRKAYQFPLQDLGIQNNELVNLINKQPSAALHVRRGDYVQNSNNLNFHGLCTIEYYKQAIECIEMQHGPQRWFIFSDDPQWCLAHLGWLNPCAVVSWNHGRDAWKDMYLMSTCSHQVIANSTFSWWAAWLNKNPQKTVIAPAPWIASNEPGFDDTDLVPEAWIKLNIQDGARV
jgi:hypothetical protein